MDDLDTAAPSPKKQRIRSEVELGQRAEYRARNRGVINDRARLYREKNKDKIAERQAAYRAKSKAKRAAYLIEYRLRKADELRAKRRAKLAKELAERPEEYRAHVRELHRRSVERLRAADAQAFRAKRAQWTRLRNSEEKWKTHGRMRTRVRASLRMNPGSGNKGGSWVALVGYTVDELIRRLQRTLPDGYTWQDYMDGRLHIDHIVPVSAFNFRTAKCHDFKRCWALTNLRLLPAEENLRKNAKLMSPFQPSLL